MHDAALRALRQLCEKGIEEQLVTQLRTSLHALTPLKTDPVGRGRGLLPFSGQPDTTAQLDQVLLPSLGHVSGLSAASREADTCCKSWLRSIHLQLLELLEWLSTLNKQDCQCCAQSAHIICARGALL